MTEISYSEIPEFVKNADIFQELDKNGNKFTLMYFKETDEINSFDDLSLYIKFIDY